MAFRPVMPFRLLALSSLAIFLQVPVLTESKGTYAPFNLYGSLWPKGRVFYKLDNDYTPAAKAVILKAMQDISSKTCVQFVEARANDKNFLFIRKSSPGEGCLGGVGYDLRPKQLVELEPSCLNPIGKVLKVLVHALGLPVENNRPDRDQYVKINWNNVNDAVKYKTRPAEDPIQKLLLAFPFDYDSVTNNNPFSFATNVKLPTIGPSRKLPANVVFGQRTHLSAIDIQKLKLLYCNKDSPVNNVTPAPPVLQINCGLCQDSCSVYKPCCIGFYCHQNTDGFQQCTQNDELPCDRGGPPSPAAILTKRQCQTCNERCSTDDDCCKTPRLRCKDKGGLVGKVCRGQKDACDNGPNCCPADCIHEGFDKPEVCGTPPPPPE